MAWLQTIPRTNDHVAHYTCLSTDTKETTGVFVGDIAYETDTGNKTEYRGSTAGWVTTQQGGASVMNLNNLSKKETELIELIPNQTGAASTTSDVWVSTKNIIDGMVYAKADTVTGTTAGTLTAHYSFDGITEVTSAAIGAAFTAAAASGAETVTVGFRENEDGADAAGFARDIKRYPFVKFSIELTNGTAAGTVEAKAKVVRYDG